VAQKYIQHQINVLSYRDYKKMALQYMYKMSKYKLYNAKPSKNKENVKSKWPTLVSLVGVRLSSIDGLEVGQDRLGWVGLLLKSTFWRYIVDFDFLSLDKIKYHENMH
jgi:hypothetical protein